MRGELAGWGFRLEVVAEGLRIIAGEPGEGAPAVWVVRGR